MTLELASVPLAFMAGVVGILSPGFDKVLETWALGILPDWAVSI